jgi:hypothetical protein
MARTTLGRIVSKNDVRIYIFSPIPNVRQMVHQLYEEMAYSIRRDAFVTMIILSNRHEQYHRIGNFTKENFWKGLKRVRNEMCNPAAAVVHLEEDLSLNSDCQIFVVNCDERIDLIRHPNFLDLVTTGITFINVTEKNRKLLPYLAV